RHGQQELPHAGEDLLLALLVGHPDRGRCLTEPEESAEQRDVVLLDAESRRALPEVGEVPWRSAEDRLDDVQKRSEGPLGATGHAYVSLGALRPQLGEQPRLSHARLADDADDV